MLESPGGSSRKQPELSVEGALASHFSSLNFSSGLRKLCQPGTKAELPAGEFKLISQLKLAELGVLLRTTDVQRRENIPRLSFVMQRALEHTSGSKGLDQLWRGYQLAEQEKISEVKQLVTLAGGIEFRRLASHSIVRSLLLGLAGNLSNPHLAQQYKDPDQMDKDLFRVLRHCSSPERSKFVKTVVLLGKGDPELQSYLDTKLVNMALHLNAKERGEVVNDLLRSPGGAATVRGSVKALLEASGNLAELQESLRSVSRAEIINAGHPEQLNALALAELGGQARLLRIPNVLSSRARTRKINDACDEMALVLTQLKQIAGSDPNLKNTTTAKVLRRIADYHLADLTQTIRREADEKLKIDYLNTLHTSLEIGLKYGICLTHTDPKNPKRWTFSEVQDVKKTLERISEGKLLFTPLLTEIQRVRGLGPRVMGQRFDSGVIKVADLAVDNHYVSLAYGGVPSLQAILAHEIGHSIQLGEVIPIIQNGDLPRKGDPLYDFEEYMEIAGWKVVSSNRYKLKNSGLSVEVDGAHHAMNVPVFHQGKNVIFSYNQGVLFSNDVNGEFSLITYGRTNPWEDWAESFCEYTLLPERLIEFAPNKFKYFEHEFGMYKRDTRLALLLERSLQRRKKP